jgi:hypothetical protein
MAMRIPLGIARPSNGSQSVEMVQSRPGKKPNALDS